MRFLTVILSIVIIFTNCSWNTLRKQEMETMKSEYVLRYGKPPDLWPVTVGMTSDNTDIFSVPVENAVGANCLNNAITLLRFNKDQVVYDEVRKDFINGVGEGDKYYPGIFSAEWIGYTQTRGFLLFNLKDKTFADHLPIKSGDELFTGVSAVDGGKLQFIFQVYHAYFDDGKRYLKILEFDGKGGFKQISELQAGLHKVGYLEPWAIQNKTIFVYNNDSTKITAYDINFKPVRHPFCDLFNRIKDFKCLYQLVFHPSKPIAVLVEKIEYEWSDEYKVWLACWENKDPERQFVNLFRQEISPFSEWSNIKVMKCSDFQFSPDGRWLVFRDNSEMVLQSITNPTFIAMPVDPDRQIPLGKPKILGKVMRDNAQPTSTAWIQKPLSFVVSDGLVLYKWELDGLKREFKN